MVVEAYGPILLSSELVLVIGTPSIGKLAEERVDAGGPFARVFVKFTAAMLGDLQFPADGCHVIFVIRWIVPIVRMFQKAGRRRIAFQSERGDGNHIDHATEFTLLSPIHEYTHKVHNDCAGV
jgi:hypothetical protein